MTCTGHSPRFELKKIVKKTSRCVKPIAPNPTTQHNVSLFSFLATWMGLWESGVKKREVI